jgi:RNA polymerase sigma-70 factor, ECF subfamily
VDVSLREVGPAGRERFGALFAAEFAYVWTTLRRLGVKAADLEDVTHDVFMQVYKKIDTYDPARPARPWLFAFAYRTASDYRRLARHREDSSGDVPEIRAGAPLADELLVQREESELVHAALGALDLERRAVLVAFEMDGVPMKDVAAAMQVPLHTAYSRLRLAREDFTAAVRRLQRRGGDA